jgi:hypothetical protein
LAAAFIAKAVFHFVNYPRSDSELKSNLQRRLCGWVHRAELPHDRRSREGSVASEKREREEEAVGPEITPLSAQTAVGRMRPAHSPSDGWSPQRVSRSSQSDPGSRFRPATGPRHLGRRRRISGPR